ncbi:MAG: hypothetical protein ACKOAY_09145 [Haliscomenobacter sp.]
MKKWPLIPILLGMVISAACTRKDQAAIAEQAIPQTPEETIRLYQSFLDQNDFEQAKSISTAKEAERLNEIARIVAAESQDSTRTVSRFLKLQCALAQDTARCACTIQDQYETYDTDFILVRLRNRWLIDASPQEEILFDEEELEHVLDGMLEQIH